MLTRDQKEKIVTDLQDRFSRQRISFFTDIRGISVAKLSQFRRELKKLGAEFRVAKKTLLKRSLDEAGIALEPKESPTGGFADNVQKKTQPKSYTEKVTRRSDLVYLVHGKDHDRDAWHYVLVDKNKLPLFLKQIETGSIDVALFGEVLRSARVM